MNNAFDAESVRSAQPPGQGRRDDIVAMGARADYGMPQQFSDFVGTETRKFAGIIAKEGLQMNVQ